MKKIILYSHSGGLGKKTQSGDIYDSSCDIFNNHGEKIFSSKNVNVDSSNRLAHRVEIENGIYGGIIGMHKNRYPAIFLFNHNLFKNLVFNHWEQLIDPHFLAINEYPRDLRSIYPNPNWKNKKVAVGINFHLGGDDWDWSEGCITMLESDYWRFISNFEKNEKMILEKV